MKRIVVVALVSWLCVASPPAGADKPPAGASATETLEPWASRRHPKDVAGRHTEDITAAKQEYRVRHGGTMDGTNCRSPIGGSFGVWDQSWESNRAVRLENVGEVGSEADLDLEAALLRRVVREDDVLVEPVADEAVAADGERRVAAVGRGDDARREVVDRLAPEGLERLAVY